MELIEDLEKRKLFQEDGTTYTMLDMGSYVGHRNRPWYKHPAPKWYLMAMDDEVENVHVETLVDDKGHYIRFLIDKGPIRRVLLLHYGFVFSDTIVVPTEEGFGKSYAALDGDAYSGEKYALEEYIASPKPFDLHGEAIPGEIPSLDIVTKYLNANNQLYEEIMNGPEPGL